MYPHVIRLHSAWRQVACDRAGGPPGEARWVRRFGRPSGLGLDERVWLVLDPPLRAAATLNAIRLGEAPLGEAVQEFDVTALLAERNELALELAGGALLVGPNRQASLPPGAVRLEVRSPGWVCELGLTIEYGSPPEGVVAGTLFGLAERADGYSLVVTAAGREWLYADLSPGEFSFGFSAPGSPVWRLGGPNRLIDVQVSLLAGGQAVWEARPRTAARPMTRIVDQDRLAVGDALACLSALEQLVAADPEAVDQKLNEGGLPLLFAAGVLPEETYAVCDRLGLGLVQQLSASAARSAARRLAHHPSVLVWSGGPPAAALEGTGNRPRLHCLP